MRPSTCLVGIAVLIVSTIAIANSDSDSLDPGNRFDPQTRQHRTVAGDLCTSAEELGRNQSVTVDLCQAWNDYDPGLTCSPCSLPGPEIVARLDTQAGEQLRVTIDVVSGSADVRVYLATDCEDPHGTCIAGSSGPGNEFAHTMTGAGEVYLYIDTTGECATVQVSRQAPASTLTTTFGALKAVYR